MSNFMQQALSLAGKGRYLAAPNPMVGCIIVRDNKIVGQGWHKGPGENHAEIEALEKAGSKAKGSEVYVTLEPCAHHGRTPPCVDALIKAQVKAVHIPFIDPNPLVNGKSIAKLKKHGIKVYIGEEEEQARQLNTIFFHYIKTKKPYVIAKWAMSLDGKMATATGDSRWISGEQSRQQVHQLRHEVAAILVGANTIIKDDPLLTVRLSEVQRQPLRLILDNNGNIPKSARIFDPKLPGKTIIITTKKTIKYKNIETIVIAADKNDQIDLQELLTELGKREISSVLVEGGAETLTGFFTQQAIDKFYVYIAPKIIGNITNMQDAILTNYKHDIVIEAEPK